MKKQYIIPNFNKVGFFTDSDILYRINKNHCTYRKLMFNRTKLLKDNIINKQGDQSL